MNNREPNEVDGFQYFIERARMPRAANDENWRLGFESKHREIDLNQLTQNIFDRLSEISEIQSGDLVLDIGAGGGRLSWELEKLYSIEGALYLVIDSKEVLDLGFTPKEKPIYGQFPQNYELVKERVSKHIGPVRHIIANSILHYIRYDKSIFEFFQSVIELLTAGGAAFIGDIPCEELKRAQSFTNEEEFANGKNNFSFMEFAEIASCNSELGVSTYLIPQPRTFTMSPHRIDMLLLKHEKSEKWN